MFNIILCDKSLNNIKLIIEHISSFKKINLYLIASELGEICSYSLFYNNFYFLINIDDFPLESLSCISSLTNINIIFYSIENLNDLEFYNSLEKKFKFEENSKTNPNINLVNEFNDLKFNFTLEGTLYFMDFIKIFKTQFNGDTNSFKYIFPYLAIKHQTCPNTIIWSIITSIEDMYIKNNKFDELKKLSLYVGLECFDDYAFKIFFFDLIDSIF